MFLKFLLRFRRSVSVHSLEVPYVVGFDRSGLGLDHPGHLEPCLRLFCLRPRLADSLFDRANCFDLGPHDRDDV